MNHGVDTWVWFIGAWIFDTQMLGGKSDCAACGALCGKITCGLDRQEDMKLISTCPQAEVKPCYSNASGDGQSSEFYQLMPQYHYAKQLRQTFDLGCVMRQSTVNTTHTVGSRTYPFLPQMTWTYGAKNSLNVAVGLNPDNTWGVAVANPTGIPTVQSLNGVPTQLFSNAVSARTPTFLAALFDTISKCIAGSLGVVLFAKHGCKAMWLCCVHLFIRPPWR